MLYYCTLIVPLRYVVALSIRKTVQYSWLPDGLMNRPFRIMGGVYDVQYSFLIGMGSQPRSLVASNLA